MSTQEQGVFISFEGIDGAGKSSHIDALAEQFRRDGRRVTVTREPGGTPLAEQLRELVLRQPMDSLTEAMLVVAVRHSVERADSPAEKVIAAVDCYLELLELGGPRDADVWLFRHVDGNRAIVPRARRKTTRTRRPAQRQTGANSHRGLSSAWRRRRRAPRRDRCAPR